MFLKENKEVVWVEDDTHLPTKVSPVGAQANFSLSAFPTIRFGAKTLKDAKRPGAADPSHRISSPSSPPHACLRACASGQRRRQRACPRLGLWVTVVRQGLGSLVQMAQPVAPLVPKLPTLIDQGRGSHGLGNMDLLLWLGLWGLWGLFEGLGSPSRDSQDNRSALTQLPPTRTPLSTGRWA